jgi:hypothetical protein
METLIKLQPCSYHQLLTSLWATRSGHRLRRW